MKKVIILKGLPASGKSTWAKKQIEENKGVYKRVNKDELRAMLDNSNWSKENEKFVLSLRNEIILEALEHGKSVIVDDTNLAPKHEENIRQVVKGLAEVEVKFFEIDLDEAIARDLKRPVSVGEKVIKQMYNQFLKPQVGQYTPPIDKPEAFIFDVDGTLAKMGERSAYDWSKVGLDSLNYGVADLLKAIGKMGAKILIFTGRDGICEHETKQWLWGNGIVFDYFAIRKAGDTRKDSVVKKELFDAIKDDYKIMGVFDDRNQVVEMWRSLGLTCYQVAEGDF